MKLRKMYQAIIENKARKKARRFPKEIVKRIDKVLTSLRQNPRPPGSEKLTGTDGWRIRVGDYRILYAIDDKNKLVTIYDIDHRREVYR